MDVIIKISETPNNSPEQKRKIMGAESGGNKKDKIEFKTAKKLKF